jgi:hypothetical protein
MGCSHATGAVVGLGAHDLEFAHGVAGLAPAGDSIKDDFYGGRSHLSEVHIASRLSFNSIRLGLEEIFCFLQLPDQLFDFHNRCSSNLPNKWRDIRVSFGLRRRRRLYVNEIAVFPFGFHKTHSFPLKSKFSSRKLRWQNARGTLGFRSCDSSVLDALDFDILHSRQSRTDNRRRQKAARVLLPRPQLTHGSVLVTSR